MMTNSWLASYPYRVLSYQNQWLEWQTKMYRSWIDSLGKTAAKTTSAMVRKTAPKVVDMVPTNLPVLYNAPETDFGSVKLYEERLVADKNRFKAGEVAIGKTVRVETARASVPIDKERVVIERKNFTDVGQPVAPGEANFYETEVLRLQIYEETANIHKEAFVREEVTVKKIVERDTVTAEEMLRFEDLTLNGDGNLLIEQQ